MKILLTGAFGNVGSSTLEELVTRGHEIRCFDLKNFETRRVARKYRKEVEIIWGDIRDEKTVERAVEERDLIIHLAAIIPPRARQEPVYAKEVNVGGTQNLLSAMKKQQPPPKIIYTSSVAVYGDVRKKEPPVIRIGDPMVPSPGDEYARHKIQSEHLIKNSGLTWSIFRLSYVPNSRKIKMDPLMFLMPLDTLLEFVHTKDCGLVIANAIDNNDKIWGKIFNIGGGEKCQLVYSDFLKRMLVTMGVGYLPEEAFGDDPFHCGYMDTTESQKLLNYQRYTFDDLLEEMKKRAPLKRFLAKTFRPFVRWYILSKSPYYKANKSSKASS